MNPRTFTRVGFVLAYGNLFACAVRAGEGNPSGSLAHGLVFLMVLWAAHSSKRWHPPQ